MVFETRFVERRQRKSDIERVRGNMKHKHYVIRRTEPEGNRGGKGRIFGVRSPHVWFKVGWGIYPAERLYGSELVRSSPQYDYIETRPSDEA